MDASSTLTQRLGRRLMPLHLLRVRLTKGLTVGVRAAAFDESGRVFLVRHTYVPGWSLPGGGVDPGETIRQAVARELREEGDLEWSGTFQLHDVLLNTEFSRRDHVALFSVHGARQRAERAGDYEIAAAGFFPLDALPDGTTPATYRRLDEIAGRRLADGTW